MEDDVFALTDDELLDLMRRMDADVAAGHPAISVYWRLKAAALEIERKRKEK